MICDDNASRYIMKNIRGSPAYWHSVLNDLLAMVRQLGVPTWFLTLSAADMQWPDVIKAIALPFRRELTDEGILSMSGSKKAEWIRKNPVTAARMFQHRLDTFLIVLKSKNNPIGNIADFIVRIEFQCRGSPHAHCILWIEGAPAICSSSEETIT